MTKTTINQAFTMLAILSLSAMCCEARKKNSKKDIPDEQRYHDAIVIIRNCFLLALSPLLLIFLRSLATDPAVPHIGRALLKEVKKKFARNAADAEKSS